MGFLKEVLRQQVKKQKEKHAFRKGVAQKNLEEERKAFAEESKRQSKLRGRRIAKERFSVSKKKKSQAPSMSLGDLF